MAPAFLSVAEDVTGPERPGAFARDYTFPTVVDTQGVLGRLFDIDVVPNGVLLDAEAGLPWYTWAGLTCATTRAR
jgi:hypothetical protein